MLFISFKSYHPSKEASKLRLIKLIKYEQTAEKYFKNYFTMALYTLDIYPNMLVSQSVRKTKQKTIVNINLQKVSLFTII